MERFFLIDISLFFISFFKRLGTWQPQRSILRQNVTAIRFVEDGSALLGGTRDGVL